MKSLNKKLTKRDIVGTQYIHTFQSLVDGSIFVQVISEKEYKDLGKQGAGQPQKEGYIWLHSSDYPKVNTPSGFLGENEYMIIEGDAVIKIDSPDPLETVELKKENIVNDTITETGVVDINKAFKNKILWQ